MDFYGTISYQGPWWPDKLNLALDKLKELDVGLCALMRAQTNDTNLGVEGVVYKCHIYDMIPKNVKPWMLSTIKRSPNSHSMAFLG